MLTVLHLITGLETGGAEGMLARLATGSDRVRFRHVVVSMTSPGAIGQSIAEAGIPLRGLGIRRNVPDPVGLLRLRRVLREFRPDILQTWLYHADLLGLAAWRLGWTPRLLWNLRSTETIGSTVVRRLLARWSGLPEAVIVNSREGQRFHQALGYRPRRWVHIPNGFDTAALKPNAEAGRRQRAALGIADDALVVLLPARYHPMKDHATFLAAAARFAQMRPDARFVMVGSGVESGNRGLADSIAARGIGDRVLLLGERRDLGAIYPAADIVSLASAFGEGFPNVLAEAMCCEVPCVATDIGDSAEIVGDTGAIVPPRDPEALAAGWERLAALGPDERRALGAAARAHIVEHYDLAAIVARYETLYEVVGRGGGRPIAEPGGAG
jgi:glycosyltransferase involved in cell wall biosynthesis